MTPGGPPAAAGGRPTVLVVDDDRELADLYAAWLDGRYHTRIANGGDELLDAVDGPVDVVLLDRDMSPVSGDEALEAVVRREPDVRVAMVTAVEPSPDDAGMPFDDYLAKPVSQDDLREVVAVLLERDRYTGRLPDLFALLTRRAMLERRASRAELDASPEYGGLCERIRTVEAATDRPVRDLLASGAEALFRRPDTAARLDAGAADGDDVVAGSD